MIESSVRESVILRLHNKNFKKGGRMYSISEVARKFGITVRTIRYYEDVGLINKGTRKNGIRHYEKDEIVYSISCIIFMKSLNFKIAEIKDILKHPIYIKEILMNIRIFLIEKEIFTLSKEKEYLVESLVNKDWKQIPINDENIVVKLTAGSTSIAKKLNKIEKMGEYSRGEINEFVSEYKAWHKDSGILIDDDQLYLFLTSNDYTKNKCLKSILRKYFECNNLKSFYQ